MAKAKLAVSDEKNYITPEGHAALEAEFQQLLKVERPEVVRVVSWAAGNGDRSENGDYIYGKRRLRQIDSRLRFLMQRMDLAIIVDPATQAGLEKIFFGAWVTLFSLKNDTEHNYRIVGKDELEPSKGYISSVSYTHLDVYKRQAKSAIDHSVFAPGILDLFDVLCDERSLLFAIPKN